MEAACGQGCRFGCAKLVKFGLTASEFRSLLVGWFLVSQSHTLDWLEAAAQELWGIRVPHGLDEHCCKVPDQYLGLAREESFFCCRDLHIAMSGLGSLPGMIASGG